MTNRQIIIDLNKLYEEIRGMSILFGGPETVHGMVAAEMVSRISNKLSKAIAVIERAEAAEDVER